MDVSRAAVCGGEIHRAEQKKLFWCSSSPSGCGVDAITTDEVRSILEAADSPYTQIKIDEISNMGAVTIRLRSLFAVISDKK